MSRIEIVKEGITHLCTEAVVNAANEGLWEGGGVCGAIFRAAGSAQLQKACNEIGGCKTGGAVLTPGFQMDAKYIIHAVGPRWAGGRNGERELLYSAYTSSLELAKQYDCKSIGFPLISAGIFGYPVEQAWEVAAEACHAFIAGNPDYDILIRFGVPSEENRRIGRRVMEKMETAGNISFEDALKIAKEKLPEVNACVEYSDAYYFTLPDTGQDHTNGILVMKADGSISYSLPQFLLSRKAKDHGKERNI